MNLFKGIMYRETHRIIVENLINQLAADYEKKIRRFETRYDGLLEEQDDIILQLEPIMKERGRRVFGNLKQSKPRAIVIEEYPLETSAVVLSPVPGGHLVKAYIVESRLDFTCLKMALGSEGHSITLNGHPVICKEDIVSESETAIQKV